MNNNITEDYCSFEVAKLLKEKGFNIKCKYFFNEGSGWNRQSDSLLRIYENLIEHPTHALAIKWIRENFGIHIQATKPFHKDYWIIGKIPMEYRVKGDESSEAWGIPMSYGTLTGKFKSSEEAIEAALLHTLKNLIP